MEGEQSRGMQSILSAVKGLTAVVAPQLAAGLFYVFTTHLLPVTFPGAPFALATVSAVLACVLLGRWKPAAMPLFPRSGFGSSGLEFHIGCVG